MVAVATVAIVAATSARGDHGEGLDERPALAVAAPTVLPIGPADATGAIDATGATGTLESTGPAGPAGAASRVDGGVAVPPRPDAPPAPESAEGEIEAPHPTGTADSAVEAPAVGAAETPGAPTPAGVAAVTASPPNDPAGTPATAPALQALAPGSATTVGSDGTVELLDAMGGVRRVRLGRPGDQVLLADWDCDGIATVGLYRAPSGVFYEFPAWNPDGADDAVASRPRITLASGGTLRAHDPDADGCPSPVA